jgi:Protein of unknown function (DUF4019)
LLPIFCVVLAWAAATPNASAISADDQAAPDAALRWLNLLDTGRYGQSFDELPPRIRISGKRETWVDWMLGRRASLGHARTRSFYRVVHTHKLSVAPDGDYQVIGFKASFDRKKDAAEALVLTKETGKWQVSGYKLY